MATQRQFVPAPVNVVHNSTVRRLRADTLCSVYATYARVSVWPHPHRPRGLSPRQFESRPPSGRLSAHHHPIPKTSRRKNPPHKSGRSARSPSRLGRSSAHAQPTLTASSNLEAPFESARLDRLTDPRSRVLPAPLTVSPNDVRSGPPTTNKSKADNHPQNVYKPTCAPRQGVCHHKGRHTGTTTTTTTHTPTPSPARPSWLFAHPLSPKKNPPSSLD